MGHGGLQDVVHRRRGYPQTVPQLDMVGVDHGPQLLRVDALLQPLQGPAEQPVVLDAGAELPAAKFVQLFQQDHLLRVVDEVPDGVHAEGAQLCKGLGLGNLALRQDAGGILLGAGNPPG